MQLTVKVINGAEHNIQVSPDATINTIKQIIETEHSIPIAQQRLMFKGKPLADTSLLADYSITEGAKIHVSIKKEADPTAIAAVTTTEIKKPELPDTPLNRELRNFAKQNSLNINDFVDLFNKELVKLTNELNLDDIERYNEMKWKQEHHDHDQCCFNDK